MAFNSIHSGFSASNCVLCCAGVDDNRYINYKITGRWAGRIIVDGEFRAALIVRIALE
jgi:hypothetical protein